MNTQLPFVSISLFCIFSLQLVAMEKAHSINFTEIKKQEEYQSQVYFRSDVSRVRAEAYCNLLCREQMGFAKALKYYALHKHEETIKPLESFLKRFSTEVIGRSIILRDFNLKEHEYGVECQRALEGLLMSEYYLSYLITGRPDEGRITKAQWYEYWQKLEALKLDATEVSCDRKTKEQE